MSSRRKNKNFERRNVFKEHDFSQFTGFPGHVSSEKNKARELRNSSWWKRKISSGLCYYCGAKCGPGELTMDHKIPVSRGGRSEKENLVPACKECNNKKKYLLPVEWDEYMMRIKNS